MHVMDCSCAPAVFSAASDGATANRQIPDGIFWSFLLVYWDIVANYGSILTRFPHLLED